MMMGAASKTTCTCPAETFWNRQDDVCVDCPAEGFCPGGLHLPAVYEGNYGVYLGSVANREVEEQQKLAGTFVQQAGLFYDMEVYACASKSRCPGATLSFDMQVYAGAPASADHVRVAFPLPGACALTADPARAREGIACDRCQDGYYGTGAECSKCDGGATGGSIILILICPLLMIGLYRVTTSTGTQRVQAAFILVSTCGMAAFFMQTIAVFSTFAVSWPEELDWLFELSAIFMFDLQGLALSCFHGDGFAGKYWTTILVPFFLIFSAGLGYVITNVVPVPEQWKMKANQTFSMLGMLLSALYITLVKVVVAFFECPANPAADATLAKYKDVVCGSEEHNEIIPAMVIGLVFYVVGFYLMFSYAAYIAPTLWMVVGFRERWKFMLTRWRPDVWYWGCVIMTRNLLVAFAGVIASKPRVQLGYVVCIVTCTFALTSSRQPWRNTLLNHYDVVSSIVLGFIGMAGIIFVSLQNEVELLERFGMAVAEKETELNAVTLALTILISVFMALFVMLCFWCVLLLFPSQTAKTVAKDTKTCDALCEKLNAFAAKEDFGEEAERVINEATAYDRDGLANFLAKMFADQNSPSGGATDTISVKRAKKSEEPVMATVTA